MAEILISINAPASEIPEKVIKIFNAIAAQIFGCSLNCTQLIDDSDDNNGAIVISFDERDYSEEK